jgi:hypothetical protein
MSCLDCELNPVVSFAGERLCSLHAAQWADTETRHAPILSGPNLSSEKRSPQMGVKSHKPRHY